MAGYGPAVEIIRTNNHDSRVCNIIVYARHGHELMG